MASTPTKDDANAAEAERLKELGNEFYKKGEYAAANDRYTQAIKKNPKNAILYANRAAVHLATKSYLEAAHDCQKAVEIDPTYAKAWGRLGTATHALAIWPRCIEAWKTALSCLPKTNLTPAEETMKTQFTQGLAKAKAARTKIETQGTTIDMRSGAVLPWTRANELKAAKRAAGKPSCVEVVSFAYKEFNEGLEHLAKQKQLPGGGLSGSSECITLLSNTIMTDARVFHIKSQDFPNKVMVQCRLENQSKGGWVEGGSLEEIKKSILARLKKEGWSRTRPAIAVTVRVWVFQGFFRASLMGHRDFAHEVYTKAIALLEWGRSQWPNITAPDRGVVFEKSFIRGIKHRHLENMLTTIMSAYPAKECRYTFDEIIDYAKDLVEECSTDPFNPIGVPPGHIYGFWVYIKASAYSAIGWCYLQKALQPSAGPSAQEFMENACSAYLASAEQYPTDDLHHAQFLRKHLECLGYLNAPLSVTLPVAARILVTGAEAKEIWSAGSYGQALQENIDAAYEFIDKWKKEVEAGSATMETVARLEREVPKMKVWTEKDEDNPVKVKAVADD